MQTRRDFMRELGVASTVALAGCALLGPAPTGVPVGPVGTETRAAWGELLDLLRDVDRRWLGPEWRIQQPADVVEGHRTLLHLLSGAIDLYFEADPDRPRFVSMVSPTRKFLGDNPDAIYYLALLRGDRAYRVRGNVAGAVYTSFTFQRGDGSGQARDIFATRNDSEFTVRRDGSYELVLGPERRPGDWVGLDPATVSVTTRHYFESSLSVQNDPRLRIPLTIEPIDAPPPAPPPTDTEVARRLRAVARFVRESTLGMPPREPSAQPAWVSMVPNQLGAPEVFGKDAAQSAWGAVDNAYAMGPYLLQPDQALVMEGRLPRCRFANVVLWNRFMQTFEYDRRRVSLNRQQMRIERDGRFRVVVAHRDPGVPNWLDASGRTVGTVFWRFLLPEGRPERISTRVVPVAAVAAG